MVRSSRAPKNAFVRVARKVYNRLGFERGYNFVLFFIFGGAQLGFVVARFPYLSFNGVLCSPETNPTGHAAPGECYYYNMPRYRTGIMLHLACILPAAFLAIFQFVPAVRHRFILDHKIMGYILILLALISNAGTLMIARWAFGGGLDIQILVGLLAICVSVALGLAYYNIKRKQIDQHRAWMLRAWIWMGAIITARLILFISAMIIATSSEGYYSVQSCEKLLSTFPNATALFDKYPLCAPDLINGTVDGEVVVKANLSSAQNAMSSLDITFGAAIWLAWFIHAVALEIYLKLTPREAERLRRVSYRRQLECGMKNPGSAGLVVENFGDANPWTPPPSDEGAEHGDDASSQGEKLDMPR